MKKVLIINGHPNPKSFCQAIADKYFNELPNDIRKNSEILNLRELNFNPNLVSGFQKDFALEDDILRAQKLIKSSDHIVVISPIWWGGPTALLKGFIDRALLPGFAFKYREKGQLWDKLLINKSAHLFITSDSPTWYIKYFAGDTTVKMLRNSTLEFSGISPVRVTRFGKIRFSDPKKLAKNLLIVANIANKIK